MREVAKVYPEKTRNKRTGQEHVEWQPKSDFVPDLGSKNSKFTDMDGKTLDECPVTTFVRYPVWVYEKRVKAKGSSSPQVEKIGELKFITFNKSMCKALSICELPRMASLSSTRRPSDQTISLTST